MLSHRNPPALFGAGLIDSVANDVIEDLAKLQRSRGSIISGRVSRLRDGRIGRFGWKAQTATLREFISAEFAAQMGLSTPLHAQASGPFSAGAEKDKTEVNDEDCNALLQYIRSLPRPRQRKVRSTSGRQFTERGRKLFHQIGCADCHVPNVGNLVGIYSDLLLHNMAPELLGSGNHAGWPASIRAKGITPDKPPRGGNRLTSPEAPNGTALSDEWRTPPLWGIRDSGPYLHDGRAKTLEQAIVFHGGEASVSVRKLVKLSQEQQDAIIFFLKSLIAPRGGVAASER